MHRSCMSDSWTATGRDQIRTIFQICFVLDLELTFLHNSTIIMDVCCWGSSDTTLRFKNATFDIISKCWPTNPKLIPIFFLRRSMCGAICGLGLFEFLVPCGYRSPLNLAGLACSMFLISDAVCLGTCIWGTYITVHKVPRKSQALHVATSAPLPPPRILANLT